MNEHVYNQLAKYEQQGAHIFLPSSASSSGNGFFVPEIDVIKIDPNPSNKEVYPGGDKSMILTHFGLMRLARAAGVEWDHENCNRTDDRSDKLYVSFRAVGGIRKSDGRIYNEKGEYDLDLEIIEEEIKQGHLNKRNNKYNKEKSDNDFNQYVEFCTKRDFMQKRKHKLKLAESGAKDRVIRSLLSLRPSYKPEELNRPFVLVRYVLNHNHPELKQAFIKNANLGMGLYGSAPQLPQPETIEVESHSLSADIPTAEPERELIGPEEDFKNSSSEDQVRTIEQLAEIKGYGLQDYLKQTGKKLEDFTDERKFQLFKHIRSL